MLLGCGPSVHPRGDGLPVFGAINQSRGRKTRRCVVMVDSPVYGVGLILEPNICSFSSVYVTESEASQPIPAP
jgi:hypothetical protein